MTDIWLIENAHPNARPEYWYGGHDFGKQIKLAIRFTRKADAETVIAGLYKPRATLKPNLVAVRHPERTER